MRDRLWCLVECNNEPDNDHHILRMCVLMYVYMSDVGMYACMYIYVCLMLAYMHVCVCIYICMYVFMYVHVCIRMYVWMNVFCMYAHTYICMWGCINMCVCVGK